jgi:DNA-binding CsgD family transcriptional regulator
MLELLTTLDEEITRVTHPNQMLDLLHLYATTRFDLNAYGVWHVPNRPHDYRRGYPVGKSMFIHPQVRPHYAEHIKMAREHGPNVLARMAWVRRGPFTITECMLETRPNAAERWVFDLLREHGVRDGLYCPIDDWIVMFWSSRVLQLPSLHRGLLYSLAVQASIRLDEIVELPQGHPVRLTAREVAVLHHLSNGVCDARIARELGIGDGTIRTYVGRAMVKLGVKTREHAVAEALRRFLIK